MKSVLVLMVCLTVNILQINSECKPQELDELDGEKYAGKWRLIYMHENYTYFKDGISNVVEKIDFSREFEEDEGETIKTITYLSPRGKKNTREGEWAVEGATMLGETMVLQKSGRYVVRAIDYDNYYILTTDYFTCTTEYESTEVYIRNEKCDDENAIKAAKDGISKLCFNFDEFLEDPKKNCSSQ